MGGIGIDRWPDGKCLLSECHFIDISRPGIDSTDSSGAPRSRPCAHPGWKIDVVFRGVWGGVPGIAVAYFRHPSDYLWKPLRNGIPENLDLELDFSRILAGSVLRGSWIVELDADFLLGDHGTVFPGQAQLACGDRIDI